MAAQGFPGPVAVEALQGAAHALAEGLRLGELRAEQVVSGEHGVGMEKNELMGLQFSPEDLGQMQRIRDAFNPEGLLNPLKLFPSTKGCGEIRVLPVAGQASLGAGVSSSS